jgi:hypothetical protein
MLSQIDLKDKTALTPDDLILGNAKLIATGTVDAFAEFGDLSPSAVQTAPGGPTILTLPPVQFSAHRA